MADKKHTPEPWEAVTPCPGECCWHIQQVGNESEWDMINNPEMSRADAHRIVACVNACLNIPTEILEISGNELFSPSREVFSKEKLKKQRDELLAAAKQTIEENLYLADGDNCTLKVLKDAIAKVEAKS